MLVSVVIVARNSWGYLRPCLESIYRETRDTRLEVIVVDNASTDGSCDHLAEKFPHVRVIQSATNDGFAAGNNRALCIARGDILLLLNPDTIVTDRAIDRCSGFMNEQAGASLVGCRTLFPSGAYQRTVGTFPSLRGEALRATFLYRTREPDGPDSPLREGTGEPLTGPVDWVMGSFLMVRKVVLHRAGLLDERFRMYSEEMDFCRRAWDAGFQTWYFAEATIIHHWGGAGSLSLDGFLWVYASRLVYLRKHFRGTERLLVQALLYVGLLLRIPVYFLLWSVRWDRQWLRKSFHCARTLLAMSRTVRRHVTMIEKKIPAQDITLETGAPSSKPGYQ